MASRAQEITTSAPVDDLSAELRVWDLFVLLKHALKSLFNVHTGGFQYVRSLSQAYVSHKKKERKEFDEFPQRTMQLGRVHHEGQQSSLTPLKSPNTSGTDRDSRWRTVAYQESIQARSMVTATLI